MKRIFALLLGILLLVQLDARHIIGGEMTYRCLGPGSESGTMNYEFEMRIYRDCSSDGAEYDNPAQLGLYVGSNADGWRFAQSLNISIDSQIEIDPGRDNPCLIIPPEVCVEEAIYTFQLLDVPIINESYRLEYRRCCRNNSIFNIIDPGGSGATFGITLTPEAQNLCNNSPVFNDFPPIVICLNEDIDFNHSATDADGDQLVYEFCSPLLGGGDRGSFENPGDPTDCDGITPDPASCPPPYGEVQFVVPTYTPDQPMGGDPVVEINPITGMINGEPNVQGQFVVGVCVTEFRNGVELSRVQRDFQFNVAVCEPTVSAAISADTVTGVKEFTINSCGSREIDFENESISEQFIDTYLWQFDVMGDTVEYSERDITVDFPEFGTYQGIMAINPGSDCADTAFITVNIYPEINADFDFDYDTCVAGDVDFMDGSVTGADMITDWFWDFGDDSTSTEQDPLHLYKTPGFKDVALTVVDNNGCADQIEKTIQYQPAPAIIVLDPDKFVGCAPGFIKFNNLSTPIDETYDILWNFGDGNTSTEISPTHEYDQEGVYTITLEITSPIGCSIAATFPDYIRILPGPTAGFTFSPNAEEISSFNPFVQFTDLSMDAISWQWFFGEESVSFDQNPTYSFRDTGRQEIIQVVTHPSGCTDSAFAIIDVQPVVTFFLPNAFSPNNDGVNDAYKGVGATEDMIAYEMTIWNRWGEKVFESRDPNIGWNGQKNNTGRPSPPGVYAVVVQYTEPRGKQVTLEGVATLIR